MRVTFPAWPVWNYQFPQLDVKRINRITYRDGEQEKELDAASYRLAIGRNGVSGLVFHNRNGLPQTAQTQHAVAVDYET